MDNWELVGDCYVLGIMNGELVDPLKIFEASPDQVSMEAHGEILATQNSFGFARILVSLKII